MKTSEDEAFDELATRQGDWGSGFQTKPWNEDEWRRNNWRCGHGWLRGEQCESCIAAQEAVAHVYLFDDEGRPLIAWDNAKGIKTGDKLYTAPPQRQPLTDEAKAVIAAAKMAMDASFETENRELDISIPAHLATALSLRLDEFEAAPQREWVGLTDEDIHNTVGYNETREMYQFALALIAKLKEKNI